MVKRVRATRTLLLGAGVTLAGMLLAAGPASAAPTLPQPTIQDGGDNYLNGTEISAVQVNGSFGTGIERIKVRVVPSATCNESVTPTLSQTLVVSPLGGTYSAVFDLSDATQTANNLAIFPEGSAICAIARAGTLDVTTGQYVYGAASVSTNKPVKDTIVLAGTVSIIDPVSPDWLNLTESLATPNVGSPMGSIKGAWAKNPTSDATKAQVFWANATTNAAVSAACGPFPATIAYTPSSLSNGGTQADEPLAKACADAPNFAQGDEISFNARWTDVAGNVSPLATTAAFPDGNLKKDTVKPATPSVDLLGATVSWNPPLKSAAGDTITSTDVINSDNVGDITVSVNYTDGDLDYLDVTVSDGTLNFLQRRDALDVPQLFEGFDLTTLKNCGTGPTAGTNNPPAHTPHPSLGAPPAFPGECITATATATDLAGNVSVAGPSAVDNGFKDARDPLAPSVNWFPSLITDANDNLTELEVTGEPFSIVTVDVSDEDPSSVNLTNGTGGGLTKFRLDETGFGAIDLDVTTMADGTIVATVGLIDPWANAGPTVLKTATKNLTTPSLQLTSPAAGSMNARTVTFSGIAKYNNVACVNCRITIYDHPSNVPNYGNPANVAIVTTVSDGTGRFSATYTYNSSQVKRAFFRATDLSNPANPINGRPSAVRTFSVDVRIPQVAFTSPGGTFLPGDSVIVRGDATDDFSGLSGVELVVSRIDPVSNLGQNRLGQLNWTVFTVPGNQTNCSSCPGGLTGSWSYDLSSLPAGRYTVTAYAFDLAGQRSLEAQQSFNKLG